MMDYSHPLCEPLENDLRIVLKGTAGSFPPDHHDKKDGVDCDSMEFPPQSDKGESLPTQLLDPEVDLRFLQVPSALMFHMPQFTKGF